MKPRSAKQKGRIGQQEVRDMILKKFPQLEKDDVRSTSSGVGGEDILLSPKARKLMPWNIEVKWHANLRMSAHKLIEQAKHHGDYEPVICIRENRDEWFVMMRLEYFMEKYPNAENN